MVQARFALASIYDRAAASTTPDGRQRVLAGGRAMTNAPLLVLLAVAAIWPFGRSRAHKKRRRHDQGLESARGRGRHAAPIAGSEAKAMESYQLFLDVASDDPLLRAEAMRRLADLQLETTEAERARKATCKRSAAASAARSRCTRSCLKSYPELREERPRALSARARLRGRRPPRRVARDARPSDRGVSAHDAPRRGAVPPRRDAVRREALSRRRARLRRRAQARRELAVLSAVALQARLVAVQAAAVRRQPGLVLRAARPEARHRQRGDRRLAIPR